MIPGPSGRCRGGGSAAAGDGRAGRVRMVREPLPVAEVRVGTGRHGGVRFVRLRPEE